MANTEQHNIIIIVAIVIIVLIVAYAIWYWYQPMYYDQPMATAANTENFWLDADVDSNYIYPYYDNYYSDAWPYYSNYYNYSNYNNSYYRPYQGYNGYRSYGGSRRNSRR